MIRVFNALWTISFQSVRSDVHYSSMKAVIAVLVLVIIVAGGLIFFSNQVVLAPANGGHGADTAEDESSEEDITNNNDTSMDEAGTGGNPVVIIQTNEGNIEVELFTDVAPITAGNFLALTERQYYDETQFHRVIPDFMIQGGDPNTKGTDKASYGKGGPGYTIEDEFAPGLSNTRGTISMANAGPNTGGSQFFINVVDNTFLDNKHAVFGQVVSGMDIADHISNLPTGPNDLPSNPVVVEEIKLK